MPTAYLEIVLFPQPAATVSAGTHVPCRSNWPAIRTSNFADPAITMSAKAHLDRLPQARLCVMSEPIQYVPPEPDHMAVHRISPGHRAFCGDASVACQVTSPVTAKQPQRSTFRMRGAGRSHVFRGF